MPYTFIEIGWFMQLSLPLPKRSKASEMAKRSTHTVYGTGDVPNLVTNLNHVGTFVARIIADPRTLNHAAIIWEDQVSHNEAVKIAAAYLSAEDLPKEKLIVSCE